MSSVYEYYKVLGVGVGAGIADVTSSYRRLCRIYHPDISDDPESEELMKTINIAYTVLREKFRREAAFRERQSRAAAQPHTHPRQARRHPGQDYRAQGANARKADAEAEKEASDTLHGYFQALNSCDYAAAYEHLSGYDKRHISRDDFNEWRNSVARVFPMRDFSIPCGSTSATVTFNDGRAIYARKFKVIVTEEDVSENSTRSSDVEKMIINEHGAWKVFLGYKDVGDLTRAFDEQFESRQKYKREKQWEEYFAGMHPEYNMLSLKGMLKAVKRELYRQGRHGGTMTFAALSVKNSAARFNKPDEHMLRTAAKTINAALRMTDVPAYAGDGVFAILFVELRKKNAEEILARLMEKISEALGPRLAGLADIDMEHESWSGKSSANMDALNGVLKRFRKKM